MQVVGIEDKSKAYLSLATVHIKFSEAGCCFFYIKKDQNQKLYL